MKAIPWLIIGVALVGLLIGGYFRMVQTVDNSTGVDQQALNEALQQSLRDSYAPHLADVEDSPQTP